MSMPLEYFVAPLASAAVVGAVSWTAVRVSVARLEERLSAQAEAHDRAIEQIETRLKRAEHAVGIENDGGGAFMLRRECALLDRAVAARIDAVAAEVHQMKSEVHQIKVSLDYVQRRVVSSDRAEGQGGH